MNSVQQIPQMNEMIQSPRTYKRAFIVMTVLFIIVTVILVVEAVIVIRKNMNAKNESEKKRSQTSEKYECPCKRVIDDESGTDAANESESNNANTNSDNESESNNTDTNSDNESETKESYETGLMSRSEIINYKRSLRGTFAPNSSRASVNTVNDLVSQLNRIDASIKSDSTKRAALDSYLESSEALKKGSLLKPIVRQSHQRKLDASKRTLGNDINEYETISQKIDIATDMINKSKLNPYDRKRLTSALSQKQLIQSL